MSLLRLHSMLNQSLRRLLHSRLTVLLRRLRPACHRQRHCRWWRRPQRLRYRWRQCCRRHQGLHRGWFYQSRHAGCLSCNRCRFLFRLATKRRPGRRVQQKPIRLDRRRPRGSPGRLFCSNEAGHRSRDYRLLMLCRPGTALTLLRAGGQRRWPSG